MGQVGAVPAQGAPGSSDASSKASLVQCQAGLSGCAAPRRPADTTDYATFPPFTRPPAPLHWGNSCLAFSSLFFWLVLGPGYFGQFSVPSYPGWHRRFLRMCFPLEAAQAV